MNNRMKLAIACYCRVFLRLNGFVTECENERIHKRIRAWQINNNGNYIPQLIIHF